MGPGVVIVFWLMILGVFGVVCAALVAATYLGWKKKIRWLKWVAGVPAATMLICAIVCGGLLAWGIVDSMNPKSVFESTFGKPASAATTDIQSDLYWFADTGSVYLRFRTSPEEFRKLVPPDLAPRLATEMKSLVPTESGSPPEWWTFRHSSDWQYFAHSKPDREKPGKRGFYYETEYMAYDPSTQLGYFRFLGID